MGSVAVKNLSYIKINSLNSLYFIIGKMNEYIEESNGNKYLTLAPSNQRKDSLKRTMG